MKIGLTEKVQKNSCYNDQYNWLIAVIFVPGKIGQFLGFFLDDRCIPGVIGHFVGWGLLGQQAGKDVDDQAKEKQKGRPVQKVHISEPVIHTTNGLDQE